MVGVGLIFGLGLRIWMEDASMQGTCGGMDSVILWP